MTTENQGGRTASGVADFSRIRIVLVRPRHGGNVGATARAMKNMGLERLFLVSPDLECPEQARWMAPSAEDILDRAQTVATIPEAVKGCTLVIGTTARGRVLRWPIWDPEETARQALEHDGEVALLFGPEDKGLSNKDLQYCHALATVRTDRHSSLNLAHAVLLFSHHIFEEGMRRGYRPQEHRSQARRGMRMHPREPEPAPANAKDAPADVTLVRLAAERAVEVLRHTAYLSGRSPDQVGLTLFHLLQRARPTIREVEIVLGMLGKVHWSLEHPEAVHPRDPTHGM